MPRYQRIASLLTVHNLAFQGQFWHWDMLLTGLDWKYFNWRQMEFHGKLNLLKTGLVFADSHQHRQPALCPGDPDQPAWAAGWRACCSIAARCSPASSTAWTRRSGTRPVIRTWRSSTTPTASAAGKPVCKAALQKELGLPQRTDVPLVAFVGRLTEQKGIDLIAEVIQRWVQTGDVQWVILGTGQPKYHRLFESLAQRMPDRIAVRLEFSNPLAHRIEAGADMFLMPSRFEPCGLNQLYSLKYGTVPPGSGDRRPGRHDHRLRRGRRPAARRPTVSPSRSTVRWP